MSGSSRNNFYRRFAPWLIVLLLAAQGLRVCIPAADGHAHHDSAIHLESLLTTAADQHESGHDSDTDLTLSILFKLFSLSLAGGLLLVHATLYDTTARASFRFYRPDERRLRPPRGSGITPPLRAPPR